MLQPVVGLYTDRQPRPYSLTVGIGLTLVGLLLVSQASTYLVILLAATLIGMGSAIFHPEASITTVYRCAPFSCFPGS